MQRKDGEVGVSKRKHQVHTGDHPAESTEHIHPSLIVLLEKRRQRDKHHVNGTSEG